MSFVIRKYDMADFDLLLSWWRLRQEFAPSQDMMPEGTSYIIESDGKPIASMCWIRTNVKAAAYCANFISDPDSHKETRRAAIAELLGYIRAQARIAGHQKLLAFGYKPKVEQRFLEMGFVPTLRELSAFVLETGG